MRWYDFDRFLVCKRSKNKCMPSISALVACLTFWCTGLVQAQVLAVVGDISLGRHGAAVVSSEEAFVAVRQELQTDLVVGNLESPLTRRPFLGTAGPVANGTASNIPSRRYDLRADPRVAPLLRPFTHLSTENNHASDAGSAGRRQNVEAVRQQGIVPVGRHFRFERRDGRVLAWLAWLDDGKTPLPLDKIRSARQKADAVIIIMHWGNEHVATTQRQEEQAKALTEAGATLVLGSGPHVLQGHEYFKTRWGKSLVLYSLGNFLFDQPYANSRIGAIVKITDWNTLSACAVATVHERGQVKLASGENKKRALRRLALPACTPCHTLRLPKTWDVRSRAYGDITGDGRPECILVVWRPWKDWPIARWAKKTTPIRENRDRQGDSAHVAILQPLKTSSSPNYRRMWVGSALFQPVTRVRLVKPPEPSKPPESSEPLGPRHHTQAFRSDAQLLVWETTYEAGRHAQPVAKSWWEWTGFGFNLLRREYLKK